MKKEHVLMLVAGFVLGSVVTFILMKQNEAQQPASAPAVASGTASGTGPATPQGGTPAFDPNQHNSMIAQFIKKAKADPKDAPSKIMLGNIYYDKGDYQEAIPWYEEGLKLEPTNTDVLVDLGICYRELKQSEKALALFDKALQVDPKKKQALYNKVVVYSADLKQLDKARQVLQVLEREYPGDPVVQQLKDGMPKG